jgi:hypothetical protein
MKVYIFEIGSYWDTPDVTKVFGSLEYAMSHIPKGFKELKQWGCETSKEYYAQNEKSRRWLKITPHEVERENRKS